MQAVERYVVRGKQQHIHKQRDEVSEAEVEAAGCWLGERDPCPKRDRGNWHAILGTNAENQYIYFPSSQPTGQDSWSYDLLRAHILRETTRMMISNCVRIMGHGAQAVWADSELGKSQANGIPKRSPRGGSVGKA